MKKTIGIDLGTTNSVVAFKDTVIKIIRNSQNEELTRSCVAMRNDSIVVGKDAFANLANNEANTILSVKRLMGGSIKDEMVKTMIKSGHYKYGITSLTSGTDQAVAVVLGGKQYTPEQISAEILKKLKKDAEKLLGEITDAVITVPAYFTDKQKTATLRAAQLAGLRVQRLLAEPTAAAIAYGTDISMKEEAKTVLIYDFGGGTFDLSVLTFADTDFIEIGTGGDRWLGGDDLDRSLKELVYNKIANKYQIENLNKLVINQREKQRMKFEAVMRTQTEQSKIELSANDSTTIIIDNILVDENDDDLDIDITISRIEFENVIRPFVQRTIDLMHKLLKEISYDMSMIDDILLVGGSSCIPLVQEMLIAEFGTDKVKYSEKPMLAIAEGAGILSASLGQGEDGEINPLANAITVVHNAKHNLYIQVAENNTLKYDILIEKQSVLPAEKSVSYKTFTANQKIAKVAIHTDTEDEQMTGTAIGFYLIDENLPIQSEIVFEFHYSLNEELTAAAYPVGKRHLKKEIVMTRGGIDERTIKEIDELIDRSAKEIPTVEGEEKLLEYIAGKIREINQIGAANLEDSKWHEVYYNTTEKFEEIIQNEEQVSDFKIFKIRGIRLLNEFSNIIDSVDRQSLSELLNNLNTSDDIISNQNDANRIEVITDKYSPLNFILELEGRANYLLQKPTSQIGNNNKQVDVNRLLQISIDAKSAVHASQLEAAKSLADEARLIFTKYS